MARYDKKTGAWVGDSRITGFPRKQRRGFETEAAAKQWEKDRRLRLLDPEKALILLKLSQGSLDYLKHCRRQKMAANTIRDKKSILLQMAHFVGPDLLLKEVKPYHISQFLDALYDRREDELLAWQKEQDKPVENREKGTRKKPVEPGKNANRYRRQIVTFFNHFVKKQILPTNPAEATSTYDESNFEKYVPPGEDIEAIKAVANQDELDIIRVLIHTGARAGEIRNMQFNDLSPENNALTLWTTKRQGSKKEGHTMEIGPALKEILERRQQSLNSPWVFPNPDGKKMPRRSLDNIMPRLCARVIDSIKESGVEEKDITFKPFTMHSIRHFMAVQIFLREGLAKTQKFLRHKRATTTDIYIRSLLDLKEISAPVTDDIEKSLLNSGVHSKVVPLFK